VKKFFCLTILFLAAVPHGLQAAALEKAATTLEYEAAQPKEPEGRDGSEGVLDAMAFWVKAALFIYVGPADLAGDDWSRHDLYLAPGPRPVPGAFFTWLDASYYNGIKLVTLGTRAVYKRLELRLQGTRIEEWPDGAPRDFFHTAKGDLQFRFVNLPGFQMRSGLGGRGFFDANREIALGGINFIYGLEGIAGPVNIRLDGEIGNYGHSFVAEAKATLGISIGAVQIYGGYQNLDIAGVGLGGPLAGVQAAF
jgi:hypothetical protein